MADRQNDRIQKFGNATVGVERGPAIGLALQLSLPWPNPAAGSLSFNLHVPADVVSRQLSLEIISVAGRRVALLADGVMPVGSHRGVWNLLDSRGVRAPAGIYFARLRSGSQVRVRKFIITGT